MGNSWRGRTLAYALCSVFAALAMPTAVHAAPAPKIVGGGDATITDVPWQVGLIRSSLSNSAGQFCGGTIHDANTIITAAHCMYFSNGSPRTPADIDVLVGTDDLGDGSAQRLDVAAIFVNPSFDADTLGNDAARITLSSPISPFPSPTADALPLVSGEMSSLVAGNPLTVSGWGTLEEDGFSPDQLQAVDVPFVTDANCKANYGIYVDVSTMFCAGEAGKDSCQGDSGGPITRDFGGGPVLVGIVSWGIGCAQPRCPGVYTRVANPSIHAFLTGGSSAPPPEDRGTGEGSCLTGEPIPPVIQPPQMPQPRPTIDVTQPTIAVGSKSCKKLRCTIRLRVSDPQPSSGLGRLTASVSQKVGRRTRKRSASAKLVGGEYVITTGRLKRGKATVRLVISDLAGFRVARNVSLKVK